MSPQRIAGIALLIVGIILFIMGVTAADSLSDRFSKFFTGHLTDRTMWYLILGVISAIVGAGLMMVGGRKSLR